MFKFGDPVRYKGKSAVVTHVNAERDEIWVVVEGRPSFPKVVKTATLKAMQD